MARPKKDIDGEKVKKLAEYGLNNSEIAQYFEVNEGTIRKGYSEFLTKGRLNIKTKLRRKSIVRKKEFRSLIRQIRASNKNALYLLMPRFYFFKLCNIYL